MKLNNKGFSLIELLAVVVILAILLAIMVPSFNYLIEQNKENNYEKLKESIISAATMYLSDYRYEVVVSNNATCGSDNTANISSINGIALTNSRLKIETIVGNLTTDSDGNVVNPKDSSQILDLSNSYVIVKYNCNTKDYTYTLEDSYLTWSASS